MTFTRTEYRNLLLRRMPPADLELLAPHLVRCEMNRAEVVFPTGAPARDAIFPESGIISLVVVSPDGQRAEAGLFGREGFGPVVLMAGDDQSPFEGNIQLSGDAHRIATAELAAAMDASATLRALLQRFAYSMATQAAFTALSNAVHPIEERLARWILMVDDRSDLGELPLTHEFMSVMLAVRRPSVTTALHVLEGNGFIRTQRGAIAIRNRAALEEFAADAYGTPEREYQRLIGPLR